MINPDQIKKKAEGQYKNVLRSHLTGETLFPMYFPIGTIPKDYLELRDAVTQLIAASKSKLGYGYQIDLESRKTQRYGNQSLPKRIYFETQKDYLKFIKREKEFIQYQTNADLILETIPTLRNWVINHVLKVVEYCDRWPDLLKVCQYFEKNPQPNLYIRELPISVHTKFIEQNKKILQSLMEFIIPEHHLTPLGEDKEHEFEKRFFLKYQQPLVRIRLLEPRLLRQGNFPVSDITIPIPDLETLNLPLKYCLITENLMNFLTLPFIENGLAIFGSGYGVTLLKTISWLSNYSIFYWGDLDADGFRILSKLRNYFPQVISLMMDRETLATFDEFVVSVPIQDKEVAPLPYLTPDEQNLYVYLVSQGKRLEQERISHAYTLQQLERHQLPLLLGLS